MGLCKSTLMEKLFDDTYDWRLVNLNDEFLKLQSDHNDQLDMFRLQDQETLLESVKSKFVRDQKRTLDCDPAFRLLSTTSCHENIATYGGFGELRTELWHNFEPCVCDVQSSEYNVNSNNTTRKKRENCKYVMLHLGVDFNNLKAGTMVKSISDGYVAHIMNDNDDRATQTTFALTGSNSNISITKNGWGGRVIIYDPVKRLYVLYGHLDPKTLPALGMSVERGQYLATLGSPHVNGGWFCHLHLQVMTPEYVSRFPQLELLDGYCLNSSVVPDGILDPFTVY